MIPVVKSRRGMTLAELMVTLGLVTVMIAMAVSFVMMMSGQTRVSEDNLIFQQDFAAAKAVVDGWMTKVVGRELRTDGFVVTAVGEPPFEDETLQFRDGALFASNGTHLQAASIKAIHFELVQKGEEYLVFCTVDRANSDESYKFCVNPYVGDELEVSG